MEKTVVELFAGVGGFRVGLNKIKNIDKNGRAVENGPWSFVWANQWEPSTKVQHAFDCYNMRFGKSQNHSNEDISIVDKSSIPNHSLLVGGFPCQDYSVARTLSGEKGIQGKKGVLFWQIKEILDKKNTPFVLLENVDRLIKSPAKQRGRDFGIMLRTFYELGYDVEWRVINAAEYGAAQKRRRVFIFAWKKDTDYGTSLSDDKGLIMQSEGLFANVFPIHNFNISKVNNKNLTVYKDAVEMTEDFEWTFQNSGVMKDGVVSTIKTIPIGKQPIPLSETIETGKISDDFFLDSKAKEKFEYLKGGKKINRVKPNGEHYVYSEGSMSFPEDLDQPGRTMLTSEGTTNRSTHVVADYQTKKLRLITPIEAERLQSFPDDWTNTGMPNRRRYFMMGNALVTKLISDLSETLEEIIERENR
ncbi:5-methylcytosine methyltransferase [Erysipelotrichaceae bacterium MTC7]|nr:5-methylcytosine methyltransferase [Erysipelotrichaceae bacterium MTC7]